MWCKFCNIETYEHKCPICGRETSEDIPVEIYWCDSCLAPAIRQVNDGHKDICPVCGSKMKYMAKDLRPVFPEERLLMELMLGKEPGIYAGSSVWASAGRYYIDGRPVPFPNKLYDEADTAKLAADVRKYQNSISYDSFIQ